MATCEENVVQLRPNFRVTIASGPSDPRGEAESWGGGAVGNVVRTCLRWNMWKRSRSAYLKEPLDSPTSQLATALLQAAGRFV